MVEIIRGTQFSPIGDIIHAHAAMETPSCHYVHLQTCLGQAL